MRGFLIGLPLVVAVLGLPFVCSAKPLDEYIENVNKSRAEIAAFIVQDVDLSEKEIADTAGAALARIPTYIPAQDEIEYKDFSITVDNEWIGKSKRTYDSENDPEEKKKVLKSVSERLEAIAIKLRDLKNAKSRGASKDEEKQRLAEILNREEYNPAEIEDEGPVAKFYRSIVEWLRSLFPAMEPVDPQKPADFTYLRTGLQILVLGLAVALLGYVIFRFGPLIFKRFGTQVTPKKSRVILGEEIGPDATTDDLFSEAESLALKGDIRGAIRKGYISLLFELSQRKLIGLAKHKTNRDYLRDLTRHKDIRSDVSGLTVNYERHWYGRKEAPKEEWEDFKAGYRDALGRSK